MTIPDLASCTTPACGAAISHGRSPSWWHPRKRSLPAYAAPKTLRGTVVVLASSISSSWVCMFRLLVTTSALVPRMQPSDAEVCHTNHARCVTTITLMGDLNRRAA